MALNKTILSKLAEQTASKKDLQEFLGAIFHFESMPKTGWYEKKYSELLDTHCKEEQNI